MKIAVLALQGAFAEHETMLQKLGVESMQIRNLNDWNEYLDNTQHPALIIPGGESTAMMRIMHDEHLFVPLQECMKNGMPVFGTCAGMILLDDKHLDVMDITVKRNAYGRQLGSFHTEHHVEGLGIIPMTFIRAPYIERAGKNVDVLSILDNNIIAARQQNMLVCSFHPELDYSVSFHQLFLKIINEHYLSSIK